MVLGVAGWVLKGVAFEPDLVDDVFDGVEASVQVFIGRYGVHWFRKCPPRQRYARERIGGVVPISPDLRPQEVGKGLSAVRRETEVGENPRARVGYVGGVGPADVELSVPKRGGLADSTDAGWLPVWDRAELGCVVALIGACEHSPSRSSGPIGITHHKTDGFTVLDAGVQDSTDVTDGGVRS